MKADFVSVSVVLVGKFEPTKFLLKELKRTMVLSDADLTQSEYETLIPGQVTIARIGSWGKLTAMEEQLMVESAEAPYIRVADLAGRLIYEVAAGSLAWALGINVQCFYAIQEGERDRLGARLLPPGNWGPWGAEIEQSLKFPIDDPRHGGMIAAHLRQGKPDDRESGYFDVKAEPAVRKEATGRVIGVQMSANDHYAFSTDPTLASRTASTGKVVEALGTRFDKSVARSLSTFDSIIAGVYV